MLLKIRKTWRKFRLRTSRKTDYFVWMNSRFNGSTISFWQKENYYRKLANLMLLEMNIALSDEPPQKLKEK